MSALTILSGQHDIVFTDEQRPIVRQQITELEDWMLQQEQASLPPVRHIFANGLYLREGDFPAGTLITGAVHLDEHANILSRGCIRILTEDGVATVSAPATFVVRPGVKKVGVVIEDCTFTNIHANPDNIRDIEALERLLFVRGYADIENTTRG